MRQKYHMTNTWHGPEADPLDLLLSEYIPEPRGFGHQMRDPLAVCAMRVIGDFEMIHVVGGETRIVIGSQTIVLHAGSSILIPPYLPHAIETPPENPHENYWIHFDVKPVHLHSRFLTMVRDGCALRLQAENPERWNDALRRFESTLASGEDGKQTLFRSLLLEVLVLLFRDMIRLGHLEQTASLLAAPHRTKSATRTSPHRMVVRRCTEAVLAALQTDWTTSAMASLCHVSSSTLQKAFNLEMGMPPHQFVMLSRVRRAEALLLTMEQTLEEIAHEVGFSSAHALHIAFRRVYGMSPRDWRKQME